MLDVPQVMTITFLVIVAIGSCLFLYRVLARYAYEDERKGKRRRLTLNRSLLILLLFPITFACAWGAAWILLNGWEGLTGFLLITGVAGFAMGVFTVAVGYFGLALERRQERNLNKEMDTIIKTKRPLPTKTKTKGLFAAGVILLVALVIDATVFYLNGSRFAFAGLAAFEAFICFILALSPVIGRGRIPGAIYDPQVRWFMMGFITAAAILAVMYLYVMYIA
jgi:small-conductance mechanosensitive channel